MGDDKQKITASTYTRSPRDKPNCFFTNFGFDSVWLLVLNYYYQKSQTNNWPFQCSGSGIHEPIETRKRRSKEWNCGVFMNLVTILVSLWYTQSHTASFKPMNWEWNVIKMSLFDWIWICKPTNAKSTAESDGKILKWSVRWNAWSSPKSHTLKFLTVSLRLSLFLSYCIGCACLGVLSFYVSNKNIPIWIQTHTTRHNFWSSG